MLQEETGPGAIFSKLQAWAWSDPAKPGSFKDGLRCFNCTSVWLSFPAALAVEHHDVWLFFVMWFAIAGGAMIINLLVNNIKQ